MWNRILNSPLIYLFLFLSVIASVVIGFAVSNQILLPLLNIAFPYSVMFSLLANSRRDRAYAAMLFWALCMGIATVTACVHFPTRAEASVFHGTVYVQEMFRWIRTGIGTEGDPIQFIPQHLMHFFIFTVLSLLTASVLSLFMGAILMNYMSFYVGSLVRASNNTLLAIMMGWHPWSIIRVASFVILGVILGEPMICRITKRDYEYATARPFFWAALMGLALDIAMKTLLASWWGLTLRKLLS